MRTLGNILWLLLAGLWLAIGYAVAGVVSFVAIITIPFGVQAFKLAGYALWPFGRVVVRREESDVALSLAANLVWFVLAGWWLVLMHLLTALVLAVTIILIPLAVANLKMASLALAPFGKRVVTLAEARRIGAPVVAEIRSLQD